MEQRNYYELPHQYFVDCNDDMHLISYYHHQLSGYDIRSPEECGIKCPMCIYYLIELPRLEIEDARRNIERIWAELDRSATIIKRHIRGYIARKNYSCPNPTTEIGRRRLLAIFNAT